MNEIGIVKGIMKKNMFVQYASVLFKLENLDKEIQLIINVLKDYFVQFPEIEQITVDELRIYFDSLYPKYRNKVMIDKLFDQIDKAEIYNKKLFKIALDKTVKIHTVSQIVTDGIGYLDNSEKSQENILSLIEERISFYEQIAGDIDDSESDIVRLSYPEILEQSKTTGLKWRLGILNNTIGPIQPGSLGHIFGLSHAGKTALAVSETTFLIKQMVGTDQKVLFCGNEEPMRRMMERIYCSFFNQYPRWCEEKKAMLTKPFMENGGENLFYITKTMDMLPDLELKISKHKPTVCIIDQGTKVREKGSSVLKSYEKLQHIYETYRRLAVKYDCCILTTGQADSASSKVKYLTLQNLDQSKVGIPGELDFAIGISCPELESQNKLRYISICKNKLNGVLGKGIVYLDREMCVYSDK